MRIIKEFPLRLAPEQTLEVPSGAIVMPVVLKGSTPVLCVRYGDAESGEVETQIVEMIKGEGDYGGVIGAYRGTVCVDGTLHHFFVHSQNQKLGKIRQFDGGYK